MTRASPPAASAVDQASFVQAVMQASAPVPPGLMDQDGAAAGARFSVYRNNITVSLRAAMHSAFPVIAKLLGPENMDGVSTLFLRAHPPRSPVMMFYGAEFPSFLEELPQLSHLGYLGDIARLELALRHSYHAADAIAIRPDALASLSQDTLLDTQITLAPALRVICSRWPIDAIWRFNTAPGSPAPSPEAQAVMITRPEFDPVVQRIAHADAIWIQALSGGADIATALRHATNEDPDFDLTAPLTLLLQGGAITGLQNKR